MLPWVSASCDIPVVGRRLRPSGRDQLVELELRCRELVGELPRGAPGPVRSRAGLVYAWRAASTCARRGRARGLALAQRRVELLGWQCAPRAAPPRPPRARRATLPAPPAARSAAHPRRTAARPARRGARCTPASCASRRASVCVQRCVRGAARLDLQRQFARRLLCRLRRERAPPLRAAQALALRFERERASARAPRAPRSRPACARAPRAAPPRCAAVRRRRRPATCPAGRDAAPARRCASGPHPARRDDRGTRDAGD